MLRAISQFIVLFATWLLLSGHFEPLLLGLGVASCAAVAWLSHRMDVNDREGHPIHLGWQSLLYLPWLILEIVKANIAVAKLIVAPRMPIGPRVFTVTTTQHSELGQVIYANSITLTPGTVSLEVRDDKIDVHAIDADAQAGLETGAMDRRVTRVETGRKAARA